MSHDNKFEFIGGVWDGGRISFSHGPPRTFLVPRKSKHMVPVSLEELEPDAVVSVYLLVDNCCFVFSHYQYAELFKNKKG